jgi:ankyrin repeat protein
VIEAAKRGYDEQVEELLQSGHNANETDSMNNTALHWASGGGHADTVAILIASKANVDAQNKVLCNSLSVALSLAWKLSDCC